MLRNRHLNPTPSSLGLLPPQEILVEESEPSEEESPFTIRRERTYVPKNRLASITISELEQIPIVTSEMSRERGKEPMSYTRIHPNFALNMMRLGLLIPTILPIVPASGVTMRF